MLTITHQQLKILAALLWLTGGVVLLFKAAVLLSEAWQLDPALWWLGLAVATGVSIGMVKVKFIFRHVCQKNLLRIDQLEKPRLWAFYRPQFFLFLALMITMGATLSRMAQGDHPMLIAVAILDLSVATALLGSSPTFLRQRR